MVLVSQLRGLSKSPHLNTKLGLSTADLNKILDCASSIQLVAQHVLNISRSELQQFQAYSSWLHQEINTQSRESEAADNLEQSPPMNYMQTLAYIQGASTSSRLLSILKSSSADGPSIKPELEAEGRPLFEMCREESSQSKQSSAWNNLPGLESLLGRLETLCRAVFTKMAETQRRNVRFGFPIDLRVQSRPHFCHDMRMIQAVCEAMLKACCHR